MTNLSPSGTPCVMVTTMEDFSSYMFIPLLILGTWCLFEGEHILNAEAFVQFYYKASYFIVILRCKDTSLLPYRLTGLTLFSDDKYT